MKPSVFLSTVVCGLLALPAIAGAQDQPWLKDRRYTEGPGYRVGDFELHPGAALEFGYDSNYMHRSSAGTDMPGCPGSYPDCHDPIGSLRARFTPSFSFSTLGPQRRESAPSAAQPSIEFKGGLSGTLDGFIPITGSDSAKAAIKGNTNFGANVDLQLGILPGRPWSGVLNATYSRILQSGEDGTLQVFSSTGSLNRDVPKAGAELVWTPGAGLLEWRLGYQFAGTLFEDPNLSGLSNLNNTIETRGRWRFLPKTSLIFDGKFGFINYTSPTVTSGNQFTKTSSHPMRSMIGVNGLVTPSFAVLAMVGWGASFYSAAPKNPSENFDSVIGQAEVKWFLTPNPSSDPAAASLTLSAISLGFTRDFYDSYISTYFERDRGYAQLSYFYGGRFLVVVDGGAGPLLYPSTPMVTTPAAGPFMLIRADASLFGEYRIKDSWGINATFRYNQNFGDAAVSNNTVVSHLSYLQIEAYLGARWLM